MTVTVRSYSPDLAADWGAVLAGARNGIFQFARPYIEYHGTRFHDVSVLAYRDGQPVALVPAALDDAQAKVASHPGLTFGGVVMTRPLRSGDGMAVVDAVLDAFHALGARSCLFKLLPPCFAAYPSGDVAYALWRRGFTVVRRDLSSVLPLCQPLPFNTLKSRGVRRARRLGVTVGPATVAEFHPLLRECLEERHGVEPVHSRAELELLQGRFPSRIFVRAARLDGELLAGTVVFDYGHIWHTQYLASSARGREVHALDLVIAELVRDAAAAHAGYLSFGISTTDQGRKVNAGLLWQKESFGARAIVHDFMEGAL